MHKLWPSAWVGLCCEREAVRVSAAASASVDLPVVHTCDSDYSHYTGEHVLVRDPTRQK